GRARLPDQAPVSARTRRDRDGPRALRPDLATGGPGDGGPPPRRGGSGALLLPGRHLRPGGALSGGVLGLDRVLHAQRFCCGWVGTYTGAPPEATNRGSSWRAYGAAPTRHGGTGARGWGASAGAVPSAAGGSRPAR